MNKLVLICLLFALTSCKTLSPVVLTETKLGEAVTMTEMQELSSRKDVPSGIAPRDVVAKIETKSGAKVYVVKPLFNPFKPAMVYRNEQAVQENLMPTQVKDPWWKYPAYAGVVAAILATLYVLGFLKKLMWWK